MRVPDAIALFEADLKSQGMAWSTVYNQSLFVRRFGKACAVAAREEGRRQPWDVRDITPAAVARYFAGCNGRQGNRNNMTTALRKFLRFCEQSRWLPDGEGQRLMGNRKIKGYEREPKHYIPVEQFPVLLESAQRHPADRAIVALALFTLARRSELLALRLGDIDLQQANLHIWRQKRQRWTDVTVCPELMDELVPWLEWMAGATGYADAPEMMKAQPEWRVIPRLVPRKVRDTATGRWTDETVYEIDPLGTQAHVERIIKRGLDATGAVGVSGSTTGHLGEGMHTIRRSGARAMLKHLSPELGSADALVTVMTMLDHESTQQTLRYIGLDQQREQLNEWLRTNSPYGTAKPRRRMYLAS